MLNLVVLDLIWVSERRTEPKSYSLVPSQAPIPTAISASTTCWPACQEAIEKEITRRLPTTTIDQEGLTPTPTVGVQTNPKVFYYPLVNSGSTTLTDWTDVASSDFYFDLTDYPSASAVRWEVSLKALHGGGKVFVRLYDVTNKRGVDYSELETQSGTFVYLRSADLKIWRGNNLYRVQLKSVNGTEAILGSARLKILY